MEHEKAVALSVPVEWAPAPDDVEIYVWLSFQVTDAAGIQEAARFVGVGDEANSIVLETKDGTIIEVETEHIVSAIAETEGPEHPVTDLGVLLIGRRMEAE